MCDNVSSRNKPARSDLQAGSDHLVEDSLYVERGPEAAGGIDPEAGGETILGAEGPMTTAGREDPDIDPEQQSVQAGIRWAPGSGYFVNMWGHGADDS